ncbi:MAG: OmpA family protein [Odoribacter sp.]|nr:OmpA family protein [Odoribacter sp.]
MKRLLYFIILTLTTIQVKAQSEYVEIRNASIEKNEQYVTVKFEAVAQKFPANYSIKLTPILFNGEGEWMNLESLKLVGKRRNITDKRTDNVQSNRYIIKKKNNSSVEYSYTFPYLDWMQYVSLAVEQIMEGCCKQSQHAMECISEATLLDYPSNPYFKTELQDYELTELEKYKLDNSFLHSIEDYEKRYDIFINERVSGTSIFLFKTSTRLLDVNYSNNKEVLSAIAKALHLIENDPNAVLKQIIIGGYASPEGSLEYNTGLSQRRAESVKATIQKRMKNPDEKLFEIFNGREDWSGLREMVETSHMPEKQEILNIIDSYSIEQEIRKTKLKELKGGAPYRYMLDNFFPLLRSASYIQIYYKMEENTTSTQLVTNKEGKKIWINPDSPQNRFATAINSAIELMIKKEYSEALEILLEFSENPDTWNYIGVCYMMTGDYDKADLFFRSALDNGEENAQRNLEQSKWRRKLVRQ